MSNLIDRQAAIEALCHIDEYNAKSVSAIKALPSAQPVEDARAMCGECDAWNQYKNPQPGWIPCSERLPSKADHTDDMVLVCYRNGSVRFNTYMNGWVQGNPVAWMPLPTPYREE